VRLDLVAAFRLESLHVQSRRRLFACEPRAGVITESDAEPGRRRAGSPTRRVSYLAGCRGGPGGYLPVRCCPCAPGSSGPF
jgi:hypothetical protein